MLPAPAAPQAPVAQPTYGFEEDSRLPTADELRRFNEPAVVKFRRTLAPYLFVNGVIVIASIFGKSDLLGLTVMWSIYIAYRYARLWSDGFDWRDVFKQPRERELIDVADDFLEPIRALLTRARRRALRERNRARHIAARRSSGAVLPRDIGAPSSFPVSRESVFEAAGTHA